MLCPPSNRRFVPTAEVTCAHIIRLAEESLTCMAGRGVVFTQCKPRFHPPIAILQKSTKDWCGT
jgi:hypothetical protein